VRPDLARDSRGDYRLPLKNGDFDALAADAIVTVSMNLHGRGNRLP
jgi:hypothetical protein